MSNGFEFTYTLARSDELLYEQLVSAAWTSLALLCQVQGKRHRRAYAQETKAVTE